jgi:bifunctional DNA-binding transcriptional regulator/antitoxin component of YhaV-PrlF toxin-antitoxin module
LGLGSGDIIVFEKIEGQYVLKRLEARRRLEEVMSWNPERIAEPESISPKEIKRI